MNLTNYIADFKLLSKTQSNDLDFENSAYFTLDATFLINQKYFYVSVVY